MSNIIAGVIRGQLPYLEKHIAQKREVYFRYREGLKDLPVQMNPIPENVVPNYWLSCMMIKEEAMCRQERGDKTASYSSAPGKTCPTEILEALAAFKAEGRPIWKPMHLQPIYRNHPFVTARGETREGDTGSRLFCYGLCLPSDNKMTAEQQARVIEIIHRCFR